MYFATSIVRELDFSMLKPLMFAPLFDQSSLCFFTSFLGVIFTFFFEHGVKQCDFVTPFKIHWGPKWHPKSVFSAKMVANSKSGVRRVALVGQTGAPETPKACFSMFLDGFRSIFMDSRLLCDKYLHCFGT